MWLCIAGSPIFEMSKERTQTVHLALCLFVGSRFNKPAVQGIIVPRIIKNTLVLFAQALNDLQPSTNKWGFSHMDTSNN